MAWKDRGQRKGKDLSTPQTLPRWTKPLYIGRIPVRNISPRNFEEWIMGRGKMLSASSYKQERRVLISILENAVRDGLILDNPAKELPTRKMPKSQIILPTHEQFQTLIKQMRLADIRGVYGADLVELLAYSGMRLHEATELKWSDIDFDRGCFTVTGGEYGTKNHETRTVPLFPSMKELLLRIQSEPREIIGECVIPIKGAWRLMAKRMTQGAYTFDPDNVVKITDKTAS